MKPLIAAVFRLPFAQIPVHRVEAEKERSEDACVNLVDPREPCTKRKVLC